MNTRTRNNHASSEKGFTLLEVAFVITIFAVMASIVLFRFKDFGVRTAFDNLSQDIALRIVEAQRSAISGALNPNFVGTSNPPAYGVYFRTGTGAAPTDPVTHEFTYFTDIPIPGTAFGDKRYNAPADGVCPGTPAVGNECISTTAITSGEYVQRICATFPAGYSTCDDASGISANITFKRPFPDANVAICYSDGSCDMAQNVYVQLASILSPTLVNTLVVKSLGEVRVYNGPACDIVAAPGC